MTIEQVIEILKIIDINYYTGYSSDKEVIEEWFRKLKDYDFKEVKDRLDNYMEKSIDRRYAPKKAFLYVGLNTIQKKEYLKNKLTLCNYCNKKINIEDKKHLNRCRDIDYICKNVKKYLNKNISKEKISKLSDEEITDKFNKIAKIVYEKTDNSMEKFALSNYFGGNNEIYNKNT